MGSDVSVPDHCLSFTLFKCAIYTCIPNASSYFSSILNSSPNLDFSFHERIGDIDVL